MANGLTVLININLLIYINSKMFKRFRTLLLLQYRYSATCSKKRNELSKMNPDLVLPP